MTQVTLSVPDISCAHCKNSIEGALAPLDGVKEATVSISDRNVSITFDPDRTDLDTIVEAIDGQGYTVATE